MTKLVCTMNSCNQAFIAAGEDCGVCGKEDVSLHNVLHEVMLAVCLATSECQCLLNRHENTA